MGYSSTQRVPWSYGDNTTPSDHFPLSLGRRFESVGKRPRTSSIMILPGPLDIHRSMSPAEATLWKHLRAHRMGDIHFRNYTGLAGRCQGHAIGNYIVDLCAARKKLIIGLDGSQHLEQREYDEERTKYLESRGYRVLLFWNNDVMNNIDNVLQVIWSVLREEERNEKRLSYIVSAITFFTAGLD